ncbi:hypothetical protein [Actinoplanes sp. NPDC023714]|uniref:hypothetical protein n=1 Tax=Actinoplanes sp. NPDC023714 TaxID=3154322 RepID=UPI0034116136
MTDIAIRFPQTQPATLASTAGSLAAGWRLRGAAVAAAVVLGTAGSTAALRHTDHGVAVSPTTVSAAGSPTVTATLLTAAASSSAAAGFAVTSIAPVAVAALRVLA